MGTPDFAVAPLQNIEENGFNVVGVITVADKPAGRGRKLRQSPVKVYAENNGIEVLQPTNLKDPSFIEELKNLNADLQIVVAFRMLPEIVWNMPRLGTFNLHASLLPNYRGAAPINWAIINGEKETGVSTFFLEHKIDTGNILLQKKVNIEYADNAGSLHDKLMNEGSVLVVDTLNALLKDELKPINQKEIIKDEQLLKEAPKLFKENCKIDFSMNTIEVYNFIRGLSPYPAAFTTITLQNGDSKTLKVFKVEELNANGVAGTIKSNTSELIIYTNDSAIRLLELQLEGKKRMKVDEFLRGTKLSS